MALTAPSSKTKEPAARVAELIQDLRARIGVLEGSKVVPTPFP